MTKLPFLTDQQLADLERNPDFQNHGHGQHCPVCLDEGKYWYQGVEHECLNDEYGHVALRLAKLYWAHNIPLQYQKLDWSRFPHPDFVPEIEKYIEQYAFFSLNGIAFTFYGAGLGTGKTWAATYILKELVKRGISGWFTPFFEIKEYEEADFQWKKRKAHDAGILVLDDVPMPRSEKERAFLAENFENMVRPRTNANLPTIITSNMTPDQIEQQYPRVFSLLMAKNEQLEFNGEDGRTDHAFKLNVEAAMAGESLPIT